MFNIVEAINSNLVRDKPLKSLDRKPQDYYLSPSSSMCNTFEGEPIGSCIKQVWLAKKGYPQSNPPTAYNHYTFQAGNIWEDWLIEQYKQIGVYLDSNVKLVDNDLKISGEIDILHTNPIDGTTEVTECKTYNGSNHYVAKSLLGSSDTLPKPKDNHLLQVVKYLILLKRYNIDKVNLLYLDKSVSKLYTHKQFCCYLIDDDIYYDTYYKGDLVTIKEDRFNIQSLLEKDKALLKLLELNYVPEPDYQPQYTQAILEEEYSKGNVSKSKYDKVNKGLIPVNEVASWQCNYCSYWKNPNTGESTCLNIDNDTK